MQRAANRLEGCLKLEPLLQLAEHSVARLDARCEYSPMQSESPFTVILHAVVRLAKDARLLKAMQLLNLSFIFMQMYRET